jgi:hypothetical protein
VLYLHLGFHKTASTHFQGILKATFSNDKRFLYVGPLAFRKFTKWKRDDQFNIDYSEAYLKNISSMTENLILSEENICGETFDIFKHDRLYENIFSRLSSLSEFFNAFEDIEIFVSIRNPISHLPSMYCEALRWRPYRKFHLIYHGNYYQSWVPVIEDIVKAFPSSKINIMLYEHYHEDLPIILKMMGGTASVALETKKVFRPSFVSRAIKMMGLISCFIPKSFHCKILHLLDLFLRRIDLEKFQPFNQSEIEVLSKQYLKDIEKLSKIENINIISRF